MGQDDNRSGDNSTPSSWAAILITLPTAGLLGVLLFYTAELFFPVVKERWNIEGPLIGVVCAGTIYLFLAILVGYMRFRHSGSVAMCLFIGLFAPWLFHFLSFIVELARGGGI